MHIDLAWWENVLTKQDAAAVLRCARRRRLLPEFLEGLASIPQNPLYHPEGNAFTHTMLVLEAMVDSLSHYWKGEPGQEKRFLLALAALLHDVGKLRTTKWDVAKGAWTSRGHDVEGAEMAARWLKSLGLDAAKVLWVRTMVRLHMVHARPEDNHTPRAARKLMRELAAGGVEWDDLVVLMEADCAGRPPLPRGLPSRLSKLDYLCRQLAS